MNSLISIVQKLDYERLTQLEEQGRFDEVIELVRKVGGDYYLLKQYEKNVAGLDNLDNFRRGGGIHQSSSGFLADNEGLFEVMHKDYCRLNRYGVHVRDIGDKLGYVYEKAREFIGKPGSHPEPTVVVDGKYEVEIRYSGMQGCPFDEHSDHGGDVIITNLRTGKSVKFGNIIAHLAKEHGFFEGSVSYRIRPEQFMDVLDIESVEPEIIPIQFRVNKYAA